MWVTAYFNTLCMYNYGAKNKYTCFSIIAWPLYAAAQETGELVELPPTASGVQKYIDKGMWEKSRQVTKSTKNTQKMQKSLDNEDPEQMTEMQQFMDNFRAITPSSNYEKAFAQLWGSGSKSDGAKDKDKKKGEKKDPLDKLEDDPFKKCGDVKTWCETAVTKLEVLEGKGRNSKYWTPKLAKELTGHKDDLRQQIKQLTKIYTNRKMATQEVKDNCKKALDYLKASNTFITQNQKILDK